MLTLCAVEPEPASLWPLEVVKRVAAGADVFFAATLNVPGGAKLRADRGVGSASLGQFKAKVLNWPQIEQGISEVTNTLEAGRFDIDFDDSPDPITGVREWAALVEGANANGVARSAVTLQLAVVANDLDPGNWPTIFSGIIEDPRQRPQINVARVKVRNNDVWLRTKAPRRLLTSADWPDIDTSAVNKPYPVMGGSHSADAADGALPTLYIDTRGKRYLVCLGKAPFTFTVYKNGVPQSSGYTITYPIVNGKQVTLVDFAGVDQGGATITVDGFGYDDIGDGTGAPLDTPAALLLHELVNFVWGNYSSGLWLDPSTAPIDVESFLAVDDYLEGHTMRPRGTGINSAAQSREASYYLGTQKTGYDIVNQWCEAFGVKPYWNEAGKLALRVINHREQRRSATFVEGPNWIRGDSQIVARTFRQTEDPQNLLDRISITYVHDEAKGKELETMQVVDPSVGWNVDKSGSNVWVEWRENINVNLLPNGTTQDSGWTKVGAATIELCIDDPPGQADDDTTKVRWTGAGAGTFRITVANMPPALKVSDVAIAWRGKYTANGGGTRSIKPGLHIGSTDYYDTTVNLTLSWTDYQTAAWKTNPATGAKWTKADIDALEYIFNANSSSADIEEITQAYSIVNYTADAAPGPLMREIASRELSLKRREIRTTEAVLPLEKAALAIGDPVAVSYAQAVGPGGGGWGLALWARWGHILLRRKIDLKARRVWLRMLDVRLQRVPLWETDHTDLSSGPSSPGIARLGAWRAPRGSNAENRVFARNSKAWIQDPSGGGYAELSADLEKYADLGWLIEQAITPPNIQSAFVNAFSGWTRNGIGVAGSSILVDANDLGAFYPTPGAQAVKFTMGSPPGADLELTPTAALGAGGVSAASFLYKNDTQQAYYWAQRSSDSKYFRESDQTWQVAKTWNPLPMSPSPTSYYRYITKQLATSGSGITMTNYGIGVPQASASSGGVFHLAHSQLEDAVGGGATSPIVSGASAYARAYDDPHWLCHHEAQAYILRRGGFFTQFVPLWNSADAANGQQFTFFYVAGDANNFDWLFFDKTSGSVIFRRMVDGVSYDATIAATFTRGTLYAVGSRHVSEDGELGLTAFSHDVFFGPAGSMVRGTRVTAVPHAYIAAPYTLYLGHKAGTAHANGYFRHHRFFGPAPPYDVELQRLP